MGYPSHAFACNEYRAVPHCTAVYRTVPHNSGGAFSTALYRGGGYSVPHCIRGEFIAAPHPTALYRFVQEEYSEEDDEEDEDLSAALATLRMQQEGRKGGASRSGQTGGRAASLSGDGASREPSPGTGVITQVSMISI